MNFEKLEKLLDHFVDANYAPGNTMQVSLAGKEVFNYSCGYSDEKKKIKMTGNEHFFLYSCSKIATVTAALQLLEKGAFLLDDPLYEYIPEYKEMYIKNADGEITRAANEKMRGFGIVIIGGAPHANSGCSIGDIRIGVAIKEPERNVNSLYLLDTVIVRKEFR